MPRTPTEITFNKDYMTVNALKDSAETLETIFREFDRHIASDSVVAWDKDQAKKFIISVMQFRDNYKIR